MKEYLGVGIHLRRVAGDEVTEVSREDSVVEVAFEDLFARFTPGKDSHSWPPLSVHLERWDAVPFPRTNIGSGTSNPEGEEYSANYTRQIRNYWLARMESDSETARRMNQTLTHLFEDDKSSDVL